MGPSQAEEGPCELPHFAALPMYCLADVMHTPVQSRAGRHVAIETGSLSWQDNAMHWAGAVARTVGDSDREWHWCGAMGNR